MTWVRATIQIVARGVQTGVFLVRSCCHGGQSAAFVRPEHASAKPVQVTIARFEWSDGAELALASDHGETMVRVMKAMYASVRNAAWVGEIRQAAIAVERARPRSLRKEKQEGRVAPGPYCDVARGWLKSHSVRPEELGTVSVSFKETGLRVQWLTEADALALIEAYRDIKLKKREGVPA